MGTKKFCDATGEEIPLNRGIEVVVTQTWLANHNGEHGTMTDEALFAMATDRLPEKRYHFKSWNVIPAGLFNNIGSNNDVVKVTMTNLDILNVKNNNKTIYTTHGIKTH